MTEICIVICITVIILCLFFAACYCRYIQYKELDKRLNKKEILFICKHTLERYKNIDLTAKHSKELIEILKDIYKISNE